MYRQRYSKAHDGDADEERHLNEEVEPTNEHRRSSQAGGDCTCKDRRAHVANGKLGTRLASGSRLKWKK